MNQCIHSAAIASARRPPVWRLKFVITFEMVSRELFAVRYASHNRTTMRTAIAIVETVRASIQVFVKVGNVGLHCFFTSHPDPWEPQLRYA